MRFICLFVFLFQIYSEEVNDRFVFDYAKQQMDLKNFDVAIQEFKDRINKHGDPEEIWYSKYMIGCCCEADGDWEQALSWYLDAFQTNSDRPEPLRRISSYYRHHGQNGLSHFFAKYGALLSEQPDHKYIDPSYADYQFEEDLSIVSYYTRFREDGFIAASDLMIRKNVPWGTKEIASKNILFYVQNIQNARFQPIEIELPLIEEGFDELYHPMNPSICKTDDGYHVICRSVNYTQKGAKIFHTIDRDGIYRTRNFLLVYDRDFNLLSQDEIKESLDRRRSISIVQGLEDCRIFNYENCDWFTCTTRDRNPAEVPQIVLCRIRDKGAVDYFLPLLGPDVNRCEKNWLPFVKDGEMRLIYSSDPFVVYKPNLVTGECEAVLNDQPSYDFSRFRGSAAPIEFNDGYLMLIHEVSFLEDGSRVYLHRFVFLDANLGIKKLSRPFTFRHQGIEFCCGMTLNHSVDEIVMTVGLEDNQAMLLFIAVKEVQAILLEL